MSDPEDTADDLGRLDPVEVLDPMRWQRPWAQWDVWGLYLRGHQDKTASKIRGELRAIACETSKRLLNGLDVKDQHFHTRGLREARAELN
ncbi:hypothetical protein [Nocardia grenadensis]